MQPGRKILNLRHDLKISQQELARASDITPSALSKIESGINSPRAHILWRIAKYLGVSIEYILDESLPYPYAGFRYLGKDPSHKALRSSVRIQVTQEEKKFLEAIRACNPIARDIARCVPEAPTDVLRVIHFLIHNSRQAPRTQLLQHFQELIDDETGGPRPRPPAGEPEADSAPESRTAPRRTRQTPRKKTSKPSRARTKKSSTRSKKAGKSGGSRRSGSRKVRR